MPSRASKPKPEPRDFSAIARRVVEEAIGEHLDGSPLPEPKPDTRNPAAVALSKLVVEGRQGAGREFVEEASGRDRGTAGLDLTASLLACCNLFTRAPSHFGCLLRRGIINGHWGYPGWPFFFFRRKRDTEMAIYIVAMESTNGQKSASICATGRTRRECIQNAVDEASARDGIVYRATATTNLKKVVDAPLFPPTPSPRRIYVSPKPRPRSN